MDNTKPKLVTIDKKAFVLQGISPRIIDEASRVRKITYSNVLREGALTIEEANKIIEERQILTDDDHIKHAQNRITVGLLEEQLKDESLTQKIKEELALEINRMRNELIEYGLKLNEIMMNTAESISQDEADVFIAFKIICDEKNVPIFKSVEELKVQSDKNMTYGKLVEEALYFVKGFERDFEDTYSEVQILKDGGYMKSQLTGAWEKTPELETKEVTVEEKEESKPKEKSDKKKKKNTKKEKSDK